MRKSIISCLATCAVSVLGKCYEPSPAFPVPSWTSNLAAKLRPTFDIIQERIQEIVSESKYDNTSYSVEVTSSTETLWGSWHTARNQNETRPGTRHVDASSQYRIASITKVFTVLAILHQQKAGNLSLEAPVSQYISALNSPDYELPWKDITLRALASQLSGIPREFAQGDILNLVADPTTLGLPPVSQENNLPACDEYNKYKPCNASDLLSTLKNFSPLFAPNQKSTYSNVNFELLGLVLENVTGMPYEDYITHAIFQPLNMTSSTLTTPPSDTHAVLPLVPPEGLYSEGGNYWDVDEGIQAPTGGIYSSSTDMSAFLRYILTHYNALATGVNFLLPQSYGTGIHNAYGLPFEIFRTDTLLRPSTRRPVTFATKSGGLPGYYSLISLLDEYALGFTILVGGDAPLVPRIQSLLAELLVPAAEQVIWNSIDKTYTGHYRPVSPSLNSSLSLKTSPAKGLHLSHFISNSTDVLQALGGELGAAAGTPWHAQLIPTLLFEDEENQQGEIWRVTAVNERTEDAEAGVWDEHCVTDVDVLRYAGQPVTKVVFWHEKGVVELPAFQLTLRRVPEGEGEEGLTVPKVDL
ncbi:Hypothetical predicted protein [Lecanosticta acicola]|uniref:Beta-lactamase-related domain-containing protein n=1 Tax=Lecanosticta acicola TaxID=111012 RepID=A0AAI8YWP3_9PEZI|nr:Hypothetical predicted protein [Lecanosticta acicola]